MGLFDRFFAPDQEETIQAMENSLVHDEILAWANHPYFKRHMNWLLDEATRPAEISGDPMKMVAQAVRANTLKEIRSHLERAIRAAEIAKDNERQR